MPASGRHSHKDKGDKDRKICRAIPAASFLPVFPLSVAAKYMTSTKFKWGQSVAWLIFGIFFPT